MSLKNSIIVVWVYVMYLLGIWIFFSGYLLKRIVLHKHTETVLSERFINCGDYSSLHFVGDSFFSAQNSSSIPNRKQLKRFDKAIFIIIDGLRYDFAFYNESETLSNYYRNNMKVFDELKNDFPERCFLSLLLADPPTTSLQRLYGITTGTLPTFIDISSNFASTSVTEDSIISQMNNMKKKIIFMGDDTWEGLYPHKFHRSFPFPSFNVKDLHTVDNGILDNIFTEIRKHDWDVIIAHFLGVDHCGHRYSPNHPAMDKKLKQMDFIIRDIIKNMSNDTILAVLGDHGMTESGDHGGDSFNEITTILFLYSHFNWIPKEMVLDEPIQQIDLVPTFSLLLGLPIPFSNLGKAVPHLFALQNTKSTDACFGNNIDADVGGALALAENAHQVIQYVKEYIAVSQDMPVSILRKAEETLNQTFLLWKELKTHPNISLLLKSISAEYESYLKFVQSEFREKWAKFNIQEMIYGSSVLFAAVLLNALFSFNVTINVTQLFAMLICTVFITYTVVFHVIFLYVVLFVFFMCVYFIHLRNHVKQMIYTVLNFFTFPSIVVCLLFIGSFSNSFIVYEHMSVLYMLQTIILYKFFPGIVQSFFNHFTEKSKKGKTSSYKTYIECLFFVLLLLLLRLSYFFQKCREEQIGCENCGLLMPLDSSIGPTSSYQVFRLCVSWISVLAPTIAVIIVAKLMLPEKNFTIAMICVNYGLLFVSICICVQWWLMIVPSQVLDKILGQNQMITSQTALVVSLVIFFFTWIFPLLPEKPFEIPTNHVFVSSLMLFGISMLFPLYLTAGDGLAVALFLMLLSLFIFLMLDYMCTKISDNQEDINVTIWWLSSCYWFYSTGHQAAFPTIHWTSAFIINKEVSSYVLSGIFVVMNTFSSHILHGVLLPMLLVWSNPPKDTQLPLFHLVLKYILLHGLKLLSSVLCCFLLRRHLMVWKIFTPKLIFEASGFLVTILSVTLGYLFVLRVASCLHKQIKKDMGQLWFLKDE